MSLKKIYFEKNIKVCITYMYIDEYAFNVSEEGGVPHGYDGTAFCCLFNDEEPETNENRAFISPSWKACSKYQRCTKRQADYLDVFDSETKSIIENTNDISKI